jgi:hypothetical protein
MRTRAKRKWPILSKWTSRRPISHKTGTLTYLKAFSRSIMKSTRKKISLKMLLTKMVRMSMGKIVSMILNFIGKIMMPKILISIQNRISNKIRKRKLPRQNRPRKNYIQNSLPSPSILWRNICQRPTKNTPWHRFKLSLLKSQLSPLPSNRPWQQIPP